MLSQLETESSALLLRHHAMLREGAGINRAAANELARKLLDCSARAKAADLHYMVSRLEDAAAAIERAIGEA